MLADNQGIKVTLSEEDLQKDPLQMALSFWAFSFVNRVGDKING